MAAARILYVEHDADTRWVLASVLADAGHEVVGAGSTDDACAALDAGTFDVLITDVGPAHMIDTRLIISAWRRHYPAEPIVLLTGAQPTERAVAHRLPHAHYLPKPVRMARLTAIVAGLTRTAIAESVCLALAA